MNALIGIIGHQPADDPAQTYALFPAPHPPMAKGRWCGSSAPKDSTILSTASNGHIHVSMEGHLTDLPHEAYTPTGDSAQAIADVWLKSGVKGIKRLDGSYAAAIFDNQSQTLTLVTDRFGSRPIYVTTGPTMTAYSTHLPALLTMPWVSRTLDRSRLAEYLSFNAVHAPRTLIKGITQVPPGHIHTITNGVHESHKYWSMTYAPSGSTASSTGTFVDQLQSAVERAVVRATVHTQHPALLLSGGLGSMAIAAATKSLDIAATSYTISFTDDPNPETPFAGRIASILGLDHREVTISSAQISGEFDDTVAAIGHPSGNPGSVLGSLLTKAVSLDHTTVLSGHGTDELFGGAILVEPARQLRLLRATNRLPSRLKGIFHKSPGGRLNPRDFGLRAGIGGDHIFDAEARQELLHDSALVNPEVRKTTLAPYYQDVESDPLNRALNAVLYGWLCAERLPRMSRAAAVHNITPIYPLLDEEVVNIAASLPGTAKVRHRRGSLHVRWPLRAMLDGVVPRPLLRRSKKTLHAPLEAWLTGAGRLFLDARVDALMNDNRKIFQPSAIIALRDSAVQSPSASRKLWTLFVLHSWLEQNNIR